MTHQGKTPPVRGGQYDMVEEDPWFLVVGVVLIRRAGADASTPVVAQQRRSA